MKTVVGVLRGGPSHEYDVSLKSGAAVLADLNKELYEPRDIFIDRRGAWHSRGVETSPERALVGVDVVFNTIHGQYGEDGQLHDVLEALRVPYTGAERLASVLAFNKQKTKEVVSKLGVKVPYGVVVDLSGDTDALAQQLFRSFPLPAIVKPIIGGSSIGLSEADTFEALKWALERASQISSYALVEEKIKGDSASVGIIDNFRNESVYAMIPVPSSFSRVHKDTMVDVAKRAHVDLGLRHFSESDFIVSRRGVYFVETNALPKLHGESVFVQGLSSVGAKPSDFLTHVIDLARHDQIH